MGQSDTAATGERVTRRSRRWLFVVPVVVVLVAALGWVSFGGDHAADQPASGSGTSSATAEPGAAPTSGQSDAPQAKFSVSRDGNDVTVAGEVPDETTRSELVSAVRSQWASAHVNDRATVVPGAQVPDLSGLAGVLVEADGIADLGLSVSGSDLILTGTAPTLDVASRVQASTTLAFPNLKVTNNIQIPATGAPPMQTSDSATPTSAPAAAAPGCAVLQNDIVTLLRTPIGFTTGGAELTGESKQLVSRIAAKIAACPTASVSVVGYTDNVGGEALNQRLSAGRAKAVADALVSDGVAADHVSSRGAGSANPVASNDTPAGRAQNRRVAITVN